MAVRLLLGATLLAGARAEAQPCTAPGPPNYQMQASQTATNSGHALVLVWNPSTGLAPNSHYVVEASRTNFATFDYRATTTLNSVIVPSRIAGSAYTFVCRLRAVQDCGAQSQNSMMATCTARAAPASFAVTSAQTTLVAVAGGPLPTGTVRIRNIGAKDGRVTLSTTGGFFDVSPGFVDIGVGQEGAATITAKASATSEFGGASGLLNLLTSTGELTGVPVTLVVGTRADDGSRTGTKVVASVSRLTFSAPVGQLPAVQRVTLTIPKVTGSGPVFLTATVGPGGSWLVLPPNISSVVNPFGSLTLDLSVDRSKRSTFETQTPSPFRTLLKIRAVGATDDDATVVEVVDTEPLNTQSGAGGRGIPPPNEDDPLVTSPAGGTSFVIPVVVSASGAQGAVFYTDGWLRNEGAQAASADLYYTPDGKDGLTDPSVVRSNINVPAGATIRLSDLLASLLKSGGSGQLEIRSPIPGAFTLRATAESITGGDPTLRFGTEIPVTAYGSGLGLGGGELIVPGVSDDAINRANLILSETTGNSVTASVSLYDSNGTLLSKLSPNPVVPAYGKLQFNRIVTQIGYGASLTGGSLAIGVVSGNGKVAALVTVIDNRTNSFSAIAGENPLASSTAARPMAELASAPAVVIPAAARVLGAFNTQFQTSLNVANGTATPVSLNLTYNYIDKSTGATGTVSRTVSLPGRGSLPQTIGGDVLNSLFNQAGETFGWIKVEGDVNRVTAVAAISAQVDPNDPSKGVKSAQVKGVASGSPALARAGDGLRAFAGAEKSTQKRTNLIIEEVDGLPCDVRVRIESASGDGVSEKIFSLVPNQYYQITDVFGPSGLNVGDGPFQNMRVTTEVVAGSGRVVSFVTVNDNISKNPQIFVLGPAGPPPPTGSIGF